MAFRSREEYETWKARQANSPPPTAQSSTGKTVPPAADSLAGLPESGRPEPGDIELRLSPLYGLLTLFAGVVFVLLGLMPWDKGGPTFRKICLVGGAAAIAGGIALLRRRPVIVRMTSRALHLRGAVIPWTEIRDLEREYIRRNFWININLKTRRTDLDAAAQKARAALRALGQSADFDYTIMENDLPRSGIWFVEECKRRMAAAEAESR
jgi:hypothetical protein